MTTDQRPVTNPLFVELAFAETHEFEGAMAISIQDQVIHYLEEKYHKLASIYDVASADGLSPEELAAGLKALTIPSDIQVPPAEEIKNFLQRLDLEDYENDILKPIGAMLQDVRNVVLCLKQTAESGDENAGCTVLEGKAVELDTGEQVNEASLNLFKTVVRAVIENEDHLGQEDDHYWALQIARQNSALLQTLAVAEVDGLDAQEIEKALERMIEDGMRIDVSPKNYTLTIRAMNHLGLDLSNAKAFIGLSFIVRQTHQMISNQLQDVIVQAV